MPTSNETLLYHYTDAAGLVGILGGEFWLSNIQSLNDAEEFENGVNAAAHAVSTFLQGQDHLTLSQERSIDPVTFKCFIVDTLERLGSSLKPEETYGEQFRMAAFVGSLSKRCDDLSQWRAYCPPAGGYSIGFSRSALARFADASKGIVLSPCVYSTKKKEQLAYQSLQTWYADKLAFKDEWTNLARVGEHERFDASLFYTFLNLAIQCKHPAFKSEEEVRLASLYWKQLPTPHKLEFGISGSYVKPRLVVSGIAQAIREIWIGPTKDKPRAKAGVQLLLEHHNRSRPEDSQITYKVSSIPYRHG